jgi:hypothetical protein
MRFKVGKRGSWSALLVMLASMVAAVFQTAAAIEVLDQSQDTYYDHLASAQISLEQTFRPALSNVCAVAVWIRGPATVTIGIYDTVCGTLLGSGTSYANVGFGWAKVTLTTPVPVTPDAEYAFEVTGLIPGVYGIYPGAYSRGMAYVACSPATGDWDLTFRTYADDTLVPVTQHPWGQVKSVYR